MHELEIASYDAGRHWLVGPSSYLVDSALDACEEILLPTAKTTNGHLQFHVTKEKIISKSEDMGRVGAYFEHILHILNFNKVESIQSKLVLDLRLKSPTNWAHAFTNHLPLALYIRRKISIENPENILIIFPKNISTKIVDLFEASGFNVIASNKHVFGKKICFKLKPWISIRGLRHQMVREGLASTELYSKVISTKSISIDKIFISRKDTRKLVNESEISRFLQDKGYTIIYLEDYTLFEQIALLSYAKKIVAIHGAGLGPLLLRSVFNHEKFDLVELFTPAHVTDCFRVMAIQLGGNWSGVRGRSWPNLMKLAYRGNVKKFAMNDFFIDIKSLKIALGLVNNKTNGQD